MPSRFNVTFQRCTPVQQLHASVTALYYIPRPALLPDIASGERISFPDTQYCPDIVLLDYRLPGDPALTLPRKCFAVYFTRQGVISLSDPLFPFLAFYLLQHGAFAPCSWPAEAWELSLE